jgi:SNF2 family DNA or RNA helicase
VSQVYTPHAYQERGIQFILERACAGLFMHPGLGKTSTTLAAFHVLKQQGLVRNMLVLAPLKVCYTTWVKEPKKWAFSHGYSVGILHGSNKAKVLAEKHDVYVMNYDGLPWLAENLPKEVPFDILVADESTKLKHTNTTRFKTLKKMLGKFRRRYILTGTPAPNGLMDLFGQCYIMDMGASLGNYITHFRTEYFNQSGYGGYEWSPKRDAAERIQTILAPRVLTMRAEDYLELPELVESTIEIDLPTKAKAVYKQMEEALMLDFNAGLVTAANTAVASMKCRQIAGGWVYGEDGLAHHVHDAKLEALEDLIEELSGQPALVAYEFEHELLALKKRFPHAPHVGGSKGAVTNKEMGDLIERWSKGLVPVIFANPASLAHGVDGLQGAGRAVIWYTPTWNLEYREQFIKRIWRQGQTERVFVYNLIAKDTVDEAVMTAIAGKDKTQQGLMHALKKHWAL